MASSKRWKRRERQLAKQLGTVRQLHRDGSSGADLQIMGFSIQIKSRADLPKWFREAMTQAVTDCEEGSTPAVIYVDEQGSGRKASRYIMFRFEDWFLNQYGKECDEPDKRSDQGSEEDSGVVHP